MSRDGGMVGEEEECRGVMGISFHEICFFSLLRVQEFRGGVTGFMEARAAIGRFPKVITTVQHCGRRICTEYTRYEWTFQFLLVRP